MTGVHTHADLMKAAAAALIRRDGDAFNELIQRNDSWMQPQDEADAYSRALHAMQEAAYLMEGEPSDYSPDFGDSDDDQDDAG